jgi:hypothetical protein
MNYQLPTFMKRNGCCTKTTLSQKHGQKSTHLGDSRLTHELGDLTHKILLKSQETRKNGESREEGRQLVESGRFSEREDVEE